MQKRAAGTRLQVGVVLEVDLLEGAHVAEDAGHRGEGVLLEADGAQVGQPRQAHGQALVADAIVGQVQDAQAAQLLHLRRNSLQPAPARMCRRFQQGGCSRRSSVRRR